MPTTAVTINPTPAQTPSPIPGQTPQNLSPVSADLFRLRLSESGRSKSRNAPSNDERPAMRGASEDATSNDATSNNATSSQVPSFRFVRQDSKSVYERESIPDPNNIDFDNLAEDKRAPVPTSFGGSDQSILEMLNGWSKEGDGNDRGERKVWVGGEEVKEVKGGKKVEKVKDVKEVKMAVETKEQADTEPGSDSCELQFDMEDV